MSLFFSALIVAFLTFHAQYFTPKFEQIPDIPKELEQKKPVTLSIAQRISLPHPLVSAKSAILIDVHSGEVLYTKSQTVPLFPASTTKVMTAVVVLEEMDIQSVASISASPSLEGSTMGLVAGEQIRIIDLLKGLLIVSANDAAIELARNYPGGVPAFVARMNARAKELGMDDTNFENPTGFFDPRHTTTVRDLSILARKATQNTLFASIVAISKDQVTDVSGKTIHKLESTNELLETYPGTIGIKTGWTQEAGECLIAQVQRGDEMYLAVLLQSTQRFPDARILFDWGFAQFDPVTELL